MSHLIDPLARDANLDSKPSSMASFDPNDAEGRLDQMFAGPLAVESDSPMSIYRKIRADAGPQPEAFARGGDPKKKAAPGGRQGRVDPRQAELNVINFKQHLSESRLDAQAINQRLLHEKDRRLTAENAAQQEEISALKEQVSVLTALSPMPYDAMNFVAQRVEAVDTVAHQVKTAPPALSDIMRGVLSVVAGAVLGGIGSLIMSAVTKALMKRDALKTFVESAPGKAIMDSITSAASETVDLVKSNALAPASDADNFFAQLRLSAQAENDEFVSRLRAGVASVDQAPEPLAVAQGLQDGAFEAARSAFGLQYEATLGQYYEQVMNEEAQAAESVMPVEAGEMIGEEDLKGLLIMRGRVSETGDVRIHDFEFNGVCADHETHVAETPLGKLQVPTRLELEAPVRVGGDVQTFKVTILRTSAGCELYGPESRAWVAATNATSNSPDQLFADLATRSPNSLTGKASSPTTGMTAGNPKKLLAPRKP